MKDRLTEIKNRADRATKGLWTYSESIDGRRGEVTSADGCPIRADFHPTDYSPLSKIIKKQNAEFIAHSREDIPYLLAHIESVEKNLASARMALNTIYLGGFSDETGRAKDYTVRELQDIALRVLKEIE